jgi:hypothetical protein
MRGETVSAIVIGQWAYLEQESRVTLASIRTRGCGCTGEDAVALFLMFFYSVVQLFYRY